MAEADIITLDSDDEQETTPSVPNVNGVGLSIKRVQGAPTRPMMGGQRLPLPHNLSAAGPSGMVQQRKLMPRKPGVFPPFALFSQENRASVLASQADMPFGDVGRKLGEMWHALSETEKEDYRRRAREISDQKMAEYQENLRKMPPQQRQVVINNANSPQRKRRTHGYAIFSAEMKKNLGGAMSPEETANVIAESWRSASPSVRRDYEERAARVNAATLRQTQTHPQAPQIRQQAVPRPRVQYAQPNGSGLRIASVSTLSQPAKKAVNSNLAPKLPSGITISRVEPEVSILSEQYQTLQQHQRIAVQPSVRGRPIVRKPALSPAAQAAMRVKAQLRANHGAVGAFNGHRAPMVQRGRGMGIQYRGRGMGIQYGGVSPGMLKRPGPAMGGMGMSPTVAKMPRMMRPVQMANKVEQRLCRSCGLISPVGCKLSERQDLLQTLIELTMTGIDLVKDQIEGYPGEICKRCMVSINNFSAFKRTFEQGQTRLKSHVERIRPQPAVGTLPLPDGIAAQPTEFASVDIVTPSASSSNVDDIAAEESILPDLDCEVDFGENPANIPQPVDIREEKVRVITPSQEKIKFQIKSEVSQSMDSDNIVDNPNEEKVGERTDENEGTSEEGKTDEETAKDDTEAKGENGEEKDANPDSNKEKDTDDQPNEQEKEDVNLDSKEITNRDESTQDDELANIESSSQDESTNAESFDPLTCPEENDNAEKDQNGVEGEANGENSNGDQEISDTVAEDQQLLAEETDESFLNGNDSNSMTQDMPEDSNGGMENDSNVEEFDNEENAEESAFESDALQDDSMTGNAEEAEMEEYTSDMVTDNEGSNMAVDPIEGDVDAEENPLEDGDDESSNLMVSGDIASPDETSQNARVPDINEPEMESLPADNIDPPGTSTNDEAPDETENTTNLPNINEGSQDANDAFVPLTETVPDETEKAE